MIGIEAISSYIPPGVLDAVELGRTVGSDEEFISNKLGIRSLSRMSDNEEASDLCVQAFRALKNRHPQAAGTPDCVVVCTQNPDGHGIPHVSAVVHQKLKLPDACACFDISLGCSGYVYGLAIVKAFMEAQGFRRGFFFTGDPYSRILDPTDKNTILLFGDAATVTVMSDTNEGGTRFVPDHFVFATHGEAASALNNRTGRLEMAGRAIFNFVLTEVPKQIDVVLAKAGVDRPEVDAIVLHQASRYMVEQLADRLGVPREKVPLRLADHGNTVSSSIPLILEDLLAGGEARTILLSGFGVGLSWASCLLKRHEKGDCDVAD